MAQSFRASASKVSLVIRRLNHCFNNAKYAFHSDGVNEEHRFCLAVTKGFLEVDVDDADDDIVSIVCLFLFVFLGAKKHLYN